MQYLQKWNDNSWISNSSLIQKGYKYFIECHFDVYRMISTPNSHTVALVRLWKSHWYSSYCEKFVSEVVCNKEIENYTVVDIQKAMVIIVEVPWIWFVIGVFYFFRIWWLENVLLIAWMPGKSQSNTDSFVSDALLILCSKKMW